MLFVHPEKFLSCRAGLFLQVLFFSSRVMEPADEKTAVDTSGLKFRRYASIAGSSSEQLMEPIILEGFTDDKYEWVATEKGLCLGLRVH